MDVSDKLVEFLDFLRNVDFISNLQQQIHASWLFHSPYFIIVDYDSYCNFMIPKLICVKYVDICILIIQCIKL